MLLPGRTISHYRIVSPLGSGGMGVVYRAEDIRLGRPVALKFLPPEQARDPIATERLQREARAASALNHPNICTIYDVGEHEGHHFIAMELVEGQTLAAAIGGRPLALESALTLAVQMADALAAAHARGIIHRDLKPANVLVTTGGQAKILDFGLASRRQDASNEMTLEPLTNPGTALGTIAYMAPEQARGLAVDERSDIFALGLVFYEMFTGRAAFAGGTTAVIFDSILNRDVPHARSRVPALPVALDTLISRMLEKDPAARPQETAAIASELRAILRVVQSGAGGRSAAGAVPSIAVLPFKDLSQARDQQYFCEGMADEIITALSAVAGIKVASRSSAARAHDQGLDVAEIGQRLNVDHVVEGSVRKSGNRVRITAQLTSVADAHQLWTERYDRDLDDVFAVQDDIARTVAERLRVKLTGPERPLVRKATDNPEAYALCLKGRYHWARRNRWHLRSALECFEKASALDPDYALPYTGIADCYTVMAIYGVRPGGELAPRAIAAANRALELDPSLAEAHHSYGSTMEWIRRDFPVAERSYRAALALNPSLAISHAYLGLLYAVLRRVDDSRAEAAQAAALEPDSAVIAYLAGGATYWIRDYSTSERFTTQALELEHEAAFPVWIRALTHAANGRLHEAVEAAERGVIVGERQPLLMGVLGFAYGLAGRIADAERILAELKTRAADEYIAPLFVADVCIGLGRKEEALDLMDQALEQGNAFILRAGVAAEYDSLRGEPRFQDLLVRARLA